MNTKEKTLLVIAHLAMFLARTGFGLVIPLLVYLNSSGLGNRTMRILSLNILKFQAKITFTFLGLQFLGLIYQIVTNFVQSPFLLQLTFSPYNPLTIIGLVSQVILIVGTLTAIVGAIATARDKEFYYPSLWFPKKKSRLGL